MIVQEIVVVLEIVMKMLSLRKQATHDKKDMSNTV